LEFGDRPPRFSGVEARGQRGDRDLCAAVGAVLMRWSVLVTGPVDTPAWQGPHSGVVVFL
jgi:hypothetical protein